MKVALLFLPSWSVQAAPLGPACISASLRKAGHEVNVLDWNVELYHKLDLSLWDLANDIDWRVPSFFLTRCLPKLAPELDKLLEALLASNYDVVGISVFGSSLHTTAYVSKFIKERSPSTKIIWGGPNILFPDIQKEFFAYADAAVVGEGEKAAVEVLDAWTHGRSLAGISGVVWKEKYEVIQNPRSPGLEIDALPLPDFSDFHFDKYLERLVPLQFSRGCVANCSFCEEKKFLWPGFQMKNPRRIVDELVGLQKATGISSFCAADSLMNGDHRKLEQLADLLLEEKVQVYWGGNMRIDVKLTPELLRKLHRAGCGWVTFGVESGSDEILKYMRKGIRGHHIAATLKNVHEAGIKIGVNIIVGYPGEYESQFQETVRMLEESQSYISNISTAQFSIGPRSPIAINSKVYDILHNENGEIVWDETPDGVGWFSKNRESTRESRTNRLMVLRDHIENKLTGIIHNRVADNDVI
jgi:anaerobic magnesium-protoporphyrin IX monomethyl ester cyclase